MQAKAPAAANATLAAAEASALDASASSGHATARVGVLVRTKV
jgi:hypothetical protein